MSTVSNKTMMPYRWENETKILIGIKQVEERRKQRTLKHKLYNILSVIISLFDTVSANQANETVIHQRVGRWVNVSFKESFI